MLFLKWRFLSIHVHKTVRKKKNKKDLWEHRRVSPASYSTAMVNTKNIKVPMAFTFGVWVLQSWIISLPSQTLWFRAIAASQLCWDCSFFAASVERHGRSRSESDWKPKGSRLVFQYRHPAKCSPLCIWDTEVLNSCNLGKVKTQPIAPGIKLPKSLPFLAY